MLYLFYNADLLEEATRGNPDTATGGWVDDIYFFTRGPTTEHNCNTLLRMHGRAERWSATHGSKFDMKKYQLIHFTRSPKRFNTKQSLDLPGANIESTAQVRYLGITLDQPLRWWPHIKHVQAKTSISIAALASLARSTWGTRIRPMRGGPVLTCSSVRNHAATAFASTQRVSSGNPTAEKSTSSSL